MNALSWIKASILRGADGFNDLVGGPERFSRDALLDPSCPLRGAARREAIAQAAELEMASFISDGCFVAQKPNDLGDAAIWQGVYTAMTALRWSVKKDAASLAAMQAAAIALSCYFYETGPGISIIVRGAMPIWLERKLFSIDPANASRYFTDGCCGDPFAYREDASLDSMLGAMFGAAIVNRFGDAASRAFLSREMKRFSCGFTKAGFKITNRDGSVTTYGDCSPGFLQAPVRTLAAALPSLVSGGQEWRAIAMSHAAEFATTDTQVPGRISWVNANLAILASLTFAFAAPKDAPGLPEIMRGLDALLDKYADAGNSFLIFGSILAGAPVTVGQRDKGSKILSEFPIGPKPQSGLNSSTADSLQPVPVWQRPPSDVIWQRSPYAYSGSDATAFNRLDYLIAHYLAMANGISA